MKKSDVKKLDTNTKATHIVCVIDRSGSMESIREDAIGGFNSFLEEQKNIPGEAYLTLILFDNEYDVIHDATPIKNVDKLTQKTFVPRGSTALRDAIGKTINNIQYRDKDENIIMCIITDGEENSSREFRSETIMEMINHQRDFHEWEFIFLAANQDAIQTGMSLGFDSKRSANFSATSKGMMRSANMMNYVVSSCRLGGEALTSYKSCTLDAIEDETLNSVKTVSSTVIPESKTS